MQQRQLRLGDILDDYCPRERRVTNHAIVAMIGPDVKQTRCTTCDTEHEYKHAKVPRQRRKSETPAALYAPVAAGGPKRVAHDPHDPHDPTDLTAEPPAADAAEPASDDHVEDMPASASPSDPSPEMSADPADDDLAEDDRVPDVEQGPVHRPLIRATLPRQEGQPPAPRPAPEFTIRQPAGRQGRFRPRHPRGGAPFQGNRSGQMTGGMPRQGGGRPPMPRPGKRHGRKRSK
jgi:hypothetical protein